MVRPKIVKSLHYCPATKKTLEKKYTDFTSYETLPTSNAYPKEDENKNPLETEFGKSVYKDHQMFSIQVNIFGFLFMNKTFWLQGIARIGPSRQSSPEY